MAGKLDLVPRCASPARRASTHDPGTRRLQMENTCACSRSAGQRPEVDADSLSRGLWAELAEDCPPGHVFLGSTGPAVLGTPLSLGLSRELSVTAGSQLIPLKIFPFTRGHVHTGRAHLFLPLWVAVQGFSLVTLLCAHGHCPSEHPLCPSRWAAPSLPATWFQVALS